MCVFAPGVALANTVYVAVVADNNPDASIAIWSAKALEGVMKKSYLRIETFRWRNWYSEFKVCLRGCHVFCLVSILKIDYVAIKNIHATHH